MAQQTAVEWLVDQIKSDQNQKALSASEWLQVIEKAKQMEKEQISEAYRQSVEEDVWNNPLRTGDEYYNEKYNSSK